MYGIYADVIGAAEKATEDFAETQDLLEYPEIQADKAVYLSVLSKYNRLKFVRDKLAALKDTLQAEREVNALLSETSPEERGAVYEEISLLKRNASALAAVISDALGRRHVRERAYCRIKAGTLSAKVGVPLFAQIKEYLRSRGALIEEERNATVSEISFFAEGEDVLACLSPLAGAHRVSLGGKSELICLAVTSAPRAPELMEEDLKIDVFHSSGAGGQNVNKVETAVRVTHLPTGIAVTCQDERSQLQNKKRALETMERRLREGHAEMEKKRIEADVYAQFCKKNTPISFDLATATMTDTRLRAFTEVPFPLADFSAYVNALITL